MTGNGKIYSSLLTIGDIPIEFVVGLQPIGYRLISCEDNSLPSHEKAIKGEDKTDFYSATTNVQSFFGFFFSDLNFDTINIKKSKIMYNFLENDFKCFHLCKV